MTVLVVGRGSLGTTLVERLDRRVSDDKSSISKVLSVSHSELDISDKAAIDNYFHGIDEVDVVVNCAAFTDTKAAETEGYDKSVLSNVVGVKNLQWQCLLNDAHLIHISTDYVYSENSVTDETEVSENGIPVFSLRDREFPVNAYGCHKLLGEESLNPKYSTAIRVGWLYGENSNGRSFVDKIVKSAENATKDGRASISVVDDVFGIPTSTDFVADAIIAMIESGDMCHGVMNLVPKGLPTSRFEFAKAIVEGLGLGVGVVPCKSSDFKSPIRYPSNTSMKNGFPFHVFDRGDILESRTWQGDLHGHLARRKPISLENRP